MKVMIIHLIGSMRQFDEDISSMHTIADIIEANGATIALNWFQAVKDRKDRNSRPEESFDWPSLVEENQNAIAHADALIVEGSRFNYSQGYQTAIALAHNKPVLNLYRKDSKEYKEWPDKFFVSGVSHPLFTNKAYADEADLKKIVTKFIEDTAPQTKELDIKLNLKHDVYQYIDKLAKQTGRSKTSIVKDILTQNSSQST